MNEEKLKNDLSNILSLSKKQNKILKNINVNFLLNKEILINKLNLNTDQKGKINSLMDFHKNIEMYLEVKNSTKINTKEDALSAIKKYVSGFQEERLVAIYTNDRREILKIKTLSKGSPFKTILDPSTILIEGLKANAQAVLLVHNHPVGEGKFSEDDFILTQKIDNMTSYTSFSLIDHIVYAPGDGYESYRDIEQELLKIREEREKNSNQDLKDLS